jgi:flagellum-specific peptidoglycan hydrolase FlgJ
MPTILLDDLRSSIGDELRSHAQGLLQLGQGAVQSINDAIPTPPPVPQGPDPNQILQELQQHAQQAAAAAQPALQVLGNAGQAASGAVTQLGQARDQVSQQLQDHVASITQGAQDAVQSLATPPPPPPPQTTPSLGGPPPSDTTGGGPMGAIDSTTARSFAQTFGPYAQYAAQKLGIDPSWVAAMAASESNYGKAGGNELFGIKALPGEPGTSMMTHEGEGGGTNMAQTFATYASPLDAVNAYVNLLKNHYPGALNAPTLNDFVHGLKVGGYFTAGEGEYRDILQSISSRPDVQAGLQTAKNVVGGAASALGGAARGALDMASTAMNQSQFNDPQLTADEAYAACGPAAAVRFAERFGRNPTLREATDLAKQVGWTSGGGMAGITSEQQLLKNMGVDTHIVAPDWDAISKEAQTGNPVTISTPGHYFFADGYNPQTGAFHVGRSGLDLVHGAEWMTPTQMENLMGRAQGALFADNPAVPASSTAPTSLGGTGGTSNAPITIGGPAPVKAPLYVKGAMQDANGNVVADQGPTPIQSAADVLGGAAGAVGEAVGGAASALGSAAQGALAQATAPVQLQPGQVSARDQVNQVASDVQQAAQGVLGAAQDANRQTPGTSAVNAVAPVLGAAASDLGTTARGVVDAAAPVLGGALQDENAQALAFARSPVGQRLLQAAAENAQEGPSLIPAGTMSLYRDVMQVKNDWLEQNNPLNNLPGARPEPGHEGDITPGGLIAGLTTGIAQQFTDPLMLALLGPTSGLAEAGTGALSGAVSRIVGPQLAERLSPGAVSVLGTIAQKFSQGAIVGGLQNAMFEAEKKESTPESVGQALVVGAGLGGVIDVGSVPVMAVVRRIGQVLLDRAPEISAALRSRQPAQANVNAALAGVPEMAARARGEGEPTAGFAAPEAEPSTRMYHGTGSEFERPTGDRFDPNGLYGPGYYLTSDPRVAGGEVRGADVVPQPGDVQSAWGKVLDPATNPDLRRGAVVSPGYAQERAPRPTTLDQQLDMYRSRMAPAQELLQKASTPAERTYFQNYVDKLQGLIDDTESKVTPPEAGPNVRAVDVPQNLNLLNVDAPVSVENARRISDAISDAEDRRRFDIRVFPNDERTSTNGQTGDAVYQVLTRAYVSPDVSLSEAKTQAAQVLKQAGYDGITYNGGQRIPMNDAAGAPIEHQATVIFPESLDKVRNAVSGRQGGQAQVPFGINLAGGVAGGYAGNLATPQDASPEERLRNIGLGATAGLLGTHLITRGGVGPSLERAVAGVGREAGFRAPETRPTLEDQLARAADRGPRPGDNILRATTEERPPPSEEPTRQTVRGVESGTPRNIGEVITNPHLLDAAGPGETPMTMDERLAHQDTLEQRYQANQDRLAAIDEQLRNPTQKPERPPWGAGYTNDNLVEIAQQHGQSAYEPLWWEKAGLDTGSGEVRLDVGQSGIRGTGTREPTPTELRAERNTLALDQRHIEAAGEQQANAPDDAQFARRGQRAADLPFAGGEENAPHGPYATEQHNDTPGAVAADMVTRNGTKDYGNPLQEGPGQVIGTRGEVTGRGISDVEAANVGAPSERTKALMPNLDAMLKGEMPEVRAQIQKAAEDNPELMAAYQQGRISHDSMMTDLATKVGMSKQDWLKTPVGKGFSTPELAALQAAAIDAQEQSKKLATDIAARGGVGALTPEQVAHSLSTLVDNARLLAVARGGRASAGRSLNILKQRIDATMAQGINASNERIAALRAKAQAQSAVKRATQQLEQSKLLDAEQKTVVASARASGAPKNILDQIAAAYDQLDRYNAMTLHEKADDFNALKAARDAAAAKRQAAVREPPQELLSALQAELAAERKNFARRKDTWENMAFWDSKANEIAAEKRNAFRGGLYIEQYRKSADLAAKAAEREATRAFDLETRRRDVQSKKASALLEAVGGETPSRELLASYVQAINDPDPAVAAKFIKGLQDPGWWGKSQILRIAGLLSSTATHAVNMTGNVMNAALEVPTHALTIGIDAARAGITGGERQAYVEELGPMAGAWGSGFLSAFPRAIQILQTGVSPQDAVELATGKLTRPGFASGNAAVDTAVEMPLRALQAEDELFRGGGFGMQANRVATRYAYQEGFRGRQLAGRAADIIANLESYPDLYTEANNATLRMLYQEKRTVPMPMTMGKAMGSDISRGAISQVLPFVKTPANITAQGFGMSPIGLAGVAEALANRRNLRPEQLGQQTLLAEQRLARATIGTAIFGGFYALGMGALTGGKSSLTGAYDPAEASTYPQGYREWSMAVSDPASGNTYYVPFQNFGPAGVPMAMAAIMSDAHRHDKTVLDQGEMTKASTAIGQYILDNTFLQGLSDTVNVLHDPTRYGPQFVQGLVASYGPYSAMGRQVQRAMSVASRNPHDGWQGLVDALAANYPGVSSLVPEATNALGEPRTQGISGAAAFALPIRADISRDEPTLKILRDNSIAIPNEPKALNVIGGSIELSEAEQDQLKRARGAAIIQGVQAVSGTAAYQRADVGLRNEMLKRELNFDSQRVNDAFLKQLGREQILARRKAKAVPEPYYLAGVDNG